MIWRKYYELEPFIRLKNDGRELLGKEIVITEKRDGENVSIWIDDDVQPKDFEIKISSHNQIEADENIQNRLKETPEWEKIKRLLIQEKIDFHHNLILYGELMKRIGATQIERRKKNCHWIIFDIWDDDGQRWFDYNYVYQRAFQFKIPIVKCLGVELPRQYEDLEIIKKKWLKWCRRHRREGIVAKAYQTPQIFFKEKIDLPNLKRMHNTLRITLPLMPDEKCIRALQHAWDEISQTYASLSDEKIIEDAWKNKSFAMPIIAKHFSMEAREHNFKPASPYWWYVNTPIEKIKNGSNSEIASTSLV